MASIHLAPITAADADTIANLHATSWRHAYRGVLLDRFLDGDLMAERTAVWREKLATPDGWQGWIAHVDGIPTGFTFIRPQDDARWGTLVDNLHVLPASHGQGLGRRLLAEVATWCAAHAASTGVYLWVYTANTPARGFYARCRGAEVESVLRRGGDGRMLPEERVAWNTPAALAAGVG